jgi:tetratricopeptide (TPR) repeat protein
MDRRFILKTHKIVLPAFFLLACGLAASASLFGASRWLRLKSRNFELLTPAAEKKGQNLISYFERVRVFFAASMKTADESPQVVRIIGFDSEKEFGPYRINDFSRAYYTGGNRGDYIVIGDISPESYPTAVHEYVHLLLRRSGVRAPRWWYEGLADLYSTLKAYDNKVEVGEIIPARFDILIKQASWIDLADLLAPDRYLRLNQDPKASELLYAQSWALVHMLFLSEPYRPQLPDFLNRLTSGTPPEELFRSMYHKSIRQIQDDLQAYVRDKAFPRVVFPLKIEGALTATEITQATDLQVQLALANVSMGIEKGKQAGDILNRLNRDYPESWEVEESLGYLNWHAADRNAARSHFASAVEKGMSTPGSYIDYMALLGETGTKTSGLIALAEKAHVLQPASREISLKLASLYLSDLRYQQTITCIEKIGRPRPEESFQAYCLLARAYLGLGNLETAKQAAAEARAFARTSAEKAELDGITRSVNVRALAAAAKGEPPAPATQGASALSVEGSKEKVTQELGTVPAQPAIQDYQIRGKLVRIDCLGDKLRLIVEASGKTVALLLGDPNAVKILGKKTGTVAFYCGNQPDTPVVITYVPRPDPKVGTAGVISIIDFL